MDDRYLIELVRQRPLLYNIKDKNYMDIELKTKIWNEIGKKCKVEGSRCKQRWNNIRDNYRKSLTKRRTLSGEAAARMKFYKYENCLDFLQKFIFERETAGNLDFQPDQGGSESDGHWTDSYYPQTELMDSTSQHVFELANDTSNTNSVPSPTSTSMLRSAILGSSMNDNKQPVTAAAKLMDYIIQTNEARRFDSPEDLFFLSVSSSAKKLPTQLQRRFQSDILLLLEQYELKMEDQLEKVKDKQNKLTSTAGKPKVGVGTKRKHAVTNNVSRVNPVPILLISNDASSPLPGSDITNASGTSTMPVLLVTNHACSSLTSSEACSEEQGKEDSSVELGNNLLQEVIVKEEPSDADAGWTNGTEES